MLVEAVLCTRHCSKLWGNSNEQTETSVLGVGMRGQKIKKANMSDCYGQGEKKAGKRTGGLGNFATLNIAISTLR